MRLGVLGAVVGAVFVLRATVLAPEPLPVVAAAVENGRVEETVTNSRAGTAKARRRARLSPETGGQVVSLPFQEGQRVEAGQILLQLDDRSQRAQLDLARRELEAALAERRRTCLAAERAGRELARTRSLAQEQIVAADLLDQVESSKQTADAACSAAEAQAERARAAVGVAEAELSKTVLRAPFDGVVAEISIEVGEWTTPSPPALPVPPVVDILDPSSIYVSAAMDEVDSARIRTSQPVRITVDSHRDRVFPGRVARVAPYVLDIEAQNRTVEIEATFDDAAFAATLLPGTSADVEVILQVREEVLRIPTAALMEGNRVLLVRGELLEQRQIEIGLRNWDFTEVREGLSENDQVVVSLDRPEVKDGAEVEVVDELPD